jgi:tRNA A-37 threonylcarbamoyl transferase component Bud32
MGYSGGTLVAAHRGRSVVRIQGSLFLKRFTGKGREVRREREAMRLLAEGDGPDPVPLLAHGEGDRGAFLISAAPPAARPLPEALAVLEGPERHALVRHLGRRVRALHDRGLTCPDLLAHHLLVGLPDRVFLLDAARLARRSGRRPRARDLAELALSAPFRSTRRTDVVRFLAAYLSARPGLNRPFLAAVRREHRRLSLRGRHRRGRLTAAPEDLVFLERHGIRTFEDLLGYRGPGAVRLRILPDRENWRMEFEDRVFFVKRHEPVGGFRETPAGTEWEAIDLLARSGIRAMRPFALGEDVERGSTIWVVRSPGRPLDDLLRLENVSHTLRRELILEAADILRRLRTFEIHHRDMYCCHLMADPEAGFGERLTVIDLQRVRQKRGLRERWYVKDMAELLHSAPRPPVTGADLVRFLRRTFAVGKLGPREKAFARKVIAKAASIARRNREPFER